MFFDDYDKMNDGPVPYDREERFQSIFEERGCATADRNCGNEAKGYKSNTWNAESPRSKILSVHRERVVIWDVVLCQLIHNDETCDTWSDIRGLSSVLLKP